MKEEWVKETLALIEDLEKQKISLQEEYDRLQQELMDLEQHIQSGHEFVRAFMKKHNINSITPDNLKLKDFSDKSYPLMLIEIAKQSNGILNVDDAAQILLKNGISNDKKSIVHNIYNALSRSSQFIKMERGQYRFTSNPTSNKRAVKSGIREAVQVLLREHPEITNKQIVDSLINNGFDFKGKKPINSVNMALAYLRYAADKKNEQKTIEPPTYSTMPSL